MKKVLNLVNSKVILTSHKELDHAPQGATTSRLSTAGQFQIPNTKATLTKVDILSA